MSVVDVDCTVKDAEPVCGSHGVRGYPSIKYFLPGKKSGIDYNGGRDYNSLKTFTENTFKKPCDVKTKDGCVANEIEFIDKNKDKSKDELTEMRKEKEADLKAVKKELSEAQAAWKVKEKEFTKKEKNLKKAIALAKDLEKAVGKSEL